ncbi:hypothetical protein FRB99_000500 [Tulasnella sp. 403]|nr:hypothetical protein FRB99_000500 [Tulasnella sp. 403]
MFEFIFNGTGTAPLQFPKYGLRRIDAVLLTHAHADATNGLDDLRSWTLNKSIQEYIDIYLSTACFSEIKRAFPYLVSKGFATGGGDVPEFRWHIIEEHVPFAIGEDAFWVTPIEVDHGQGTNGLATPSALYTGETSDTTPAISIQESEPIPFKCFGFIVNNALLYMSDVSNIPDNEWGVIFNPPAIPWRHSAPQAPKNSEAVTPVLVSEEQVTASGPYKVLVIDVLRPKPYASHFGINEAVQATRRIGAPRNYMIGFSHEMSHDQWNLAGEIIEGKTADDVPPIVQEAVDLVQDGPSVWMRPGFDGLRLWVPEDGDEDQSIVEDGY